MLSIFSYVSGPSVCLPWRSVLFLCPVQVLCPFFNWVVCLPGVESCEFFIYFGDQVTEPKERKGPEEVWGVPSVQFTGPLGPLAQGWRHAVAWVNQRLNRKGNGVSNHGPNLPSLVSANYSPKYLALLTLCERGQLESHFHCFCSNST